MNYKTSQFSVLFFLLAIAGSLLFTGCSGSGDNEGSSSDMSNQTAQRVEILKYSDFQYSRLAAYSAEAAREQGKFHEMHDLIFENQAEWSRGNAREHFESYAEQLDLDMEQFREDVESDEIATRVENDRLEGARRTVTSTPTFFVNGRKLQQNPQNYEQMKSIVELYMYRSN